MFLEFGKNKKGQLIHISEFYKDDLFCPFCDNLITAKRGRIKIHHFAHQKGESCIGMDGLSSLDFQMYFNLSASQKEIVEKIAESSATSFELSYSHSNSYMSFYDFLSKENTYRVNKPFKTFKSLNSKGFFNYLDEYRFEANELSQIYTLKMPYKKTLKFFENQFLNSTSDAINSMYQKLNNCHLYFIDITTPNERFQKIGISNNYKRREKEIYSFLKKHYEEVYIKPILLSKIAILEHYFKKKNQSNQFKIGTASEYFKFSDQEISTLKKELKASFFAKKEHRDKIMNGLKRKSSNVRKSESQNTFLEKPKNVSIAKLLNQGYSLRGVAKELDCSVNTVRKVKSLIFL